MILTSIFLLLLAGIFSIVLLTSTLRIKQLSLVISGLVFLLSCILLIQFDFNNFYFQHVSKYTLGSSLLNLSFFCGFDGISIFFFWLSSLLIFCCVLFVFDEKKFLKEYIISLLVIEFLLLIVFSILDLFLFYIFLKRF